MNNSFLEELRRRRGEMRDSLNAVELALSAPAAADRLRWTQRVHAALAELSGDLRHHVSMTESPAGLYSEVLEAAPRLADAVARLTAEHAEMRHQIDTLAVRVDKAESLEDVTVVRDLGMALLGTFMRHRQHGSDLVYEAYEFDIGSGET